MTDVIQRTFFLIADFMYNSFGFNSNLHCDLILAVCSALACVACIRLFWRLFD